MPKAQAVLLYVFMAAALGAMLVEFHGQLLTPLQMFGAVLVVASFSLWLTARVHLGKSLSIRPKAKELVTHGLYAKIRNPIYVFGSLLILGIILYVGKLEYLLVFAVIIPMQLIRIKKEEKVLEAKFGDAYREYKKRTWF